MGIYDREYYRGETRGSGWLSGTAPACTLIIVINVVLLFLVPDGSTPHRWLAAYSRDIFYRGHVWQLLTATFLHAGPWHLFWNMLFLWWVGREMESFYGTPDFVVFYLSAAVLSTLGWALVDIASPRHAPIPMVGASGAVLAVIVLYALYYPHREILLFFVLPVEMWVLVVFYILADAYQLLYSEGGQVAVASHLTGAAYGFLFKHFDLRWSKLSWGRMRRPKLRIVAPEPRERGSSRPSPGPTWSSDPAASPKPATVAVLPEEQLDARLDEILAKIAREGRSSLTEEENRILQEASRRARNRRSDRL